MGSEAAQVPVQASEAQLWHLNDDRVKSFPAFGPQGGLRDCGREAQRSACITFQRGETALGLEPAIVNDMLHTMLREMMGSDMEADTPLMDAGVDSLMSIEFRSQVNAAFSGLGLSSTLTFDYPTIRELTGHIVEKSRNQ